MKKEFICISCPIGCLLTAEYEAADSAIDKNTVKVSGNSCPRGVVYAANEVSAPKRIVTTTLKVAGGGVVAAKTAAPVPKEKVFEVLDRLKGVEAAPPVTIGQALYKNVCDGVDMVATQNYYI